MGLSTTKLAAELGVTPQAVNKAHRRGRIRKLADGTWDLEKVRASWSQNTDQHQQARSLKAKVEERLVRVAVTPLPASVSDHSELRDPHESLAEAQRRKESAQADLRELELKQKTGELLPADKVAQTWSGIISSVRNRLLLVPSKVAPKVAVLSDVRDCQAVIEREIREALSQLADEAHEEAE